MAEDHKVQQGECVSSVAFDHGFFWETIWNHPNNSELKFKREDPNVIRNGDVIHIPDLRVKEESGGTESRHRFRVNGVPAKLHLRFLEEKKPKKSQQSNPDVFVPSADDGGLLGKALGAVKNILGMPSASLSQSVFEDPDPCDKPIEKQPRKNVEYILNIDGILTRGKTDNQGSVHLSIPPNAKEGSITLSPGTERETALPLKLGHLDPISEESGVIQRLAHLGYGGDGADQKEDRLSQSVRAFQEQNGLHVTGELDDSTREKLKYLHGS